MSIDENSEMKITSIVCMSLFSGSGIVSIYGILRSRKALNGSFLRIFFMQTLIISLLQIGTGILVYNNTNSQDIKLQFIRRCINSFSIVFQFALILTIAYGWKVACWKIKESSYVNFNDIRARRAAYITIVVSLFCMEFIASFCLLIYLLITGKTSQFVLNVFDTVFQVSIVGGCLIQVIQGRKLSRLLTRYQILFGVKMNRWRFNLVYIAAFLLSILRCVIQLCSLTFYFIRQIQPPVITNNQLAYYLLYMSLQLLPMILYLLAIKVSGQQSPQLRTSSIQSKSGRSSLETEMVDRSSVEL